MRDLEGGSETELPPATMTVNKQGLTVWLHVSQTPGARVWSSPGLRQQQKWSQQRNVTMTCKLIVFLPVLQWLDRQHLSPLYKTFIRPCKRPSLHPCSFPRKVSTVTSASQFVQDCPSFNTESSAFREPPQTLEYWHDLVALRCSHSGWDLLSTSTLSVGLTWNSLWSMGY